MATIYEFNYTGSEQSVTLKPGKYRITCYGACGGASHYQNNTPKGGRVYGTLTLKKDTKLYVYVGQSGWHEADSTSTSDNRTGFNGGGKGAFVSGSGKKYSLWGGGATDVRVVGGNWDDEQSLLSRIIVAGGGGSRTSASCTSGNGGGANGDNSQYNSSVNFSSGGTQFDGGRGLENKYSGTFGKGGNFHDSSTLRCGGGGGWFGGACGVEGSGGGSGYTLTKSSYKPVSYIPTSEYYFENVWYENGGANAYINGYCKIELLQALPFLTISSYNSTQATFKADHTDPTLLTKIEHFIDDILKGTITTDLTLEKTINYTLEDNALHTLKIVVTDSSNTTVEKVVSISKNIMPLGDDASIRDIVSKMSEIKEGLINGKTSIIDVLGLKNIESSLNNTLVELSEKIKSSFDSGDASLQDLTNKLTQANNTISQLNSKYKYASGTTEALRGTKGIVNRYGVSGTYEYGEFSTWIKVTGLNFVPNIFISFREFNTESYHYVNIVISFVGVFDSDFAITALLGFRRTSGETSYKAALCDIVEVNSRDVYVNSSGVNLPECLLSDYTTRNWHAIKFK